MRKGHSMHQLLSIRHATGDRELRLEDQRVVPRGPYSPSTPGTSFGRLCRRLLALRRPTRIGGSPRPSTHLGCSNLDPFGRIQSCRSADFRPDLLRRRQATVDRRTMGLPGFGLRRNRPGDPRTFSAESALETPSSLHLRHPTRGRCPPKSPSSATPDRLNRPEARTGPMGRPPWSRRFPHYLGLGPELQHRRST